MVHRIVVDWDLSDQDHKEHFEEVDVSCTQQSDFDLPDGIEKPRHGTVISIEEPRRVWGRDALTNLKSSLAKLINPFGASTDDFTITVHAPLEISADKNAETRAKNRGEEPAPNSIVNGDVGNFIFTTLREKTTFLEVKIIKVTSISKVC